MIKYLCLSLLFLSSLCAQSIVYLTWLKEPDTTMVIQWLTPRGDTQDAVRYRKQGEKSWRSAEGNHFILPTSSRYLVHRLELLHLTPASSYEFCFSNSPVYRFRTMPDRLERPIRFIAGGDMYHDSLEILKKMNAQAAKSNPDFALLGGDLAYASGKSWLFGEKTYRWIDWLKAWSEKMVTPDGYLIPIIAAIGNHDVNGGYGQTPREARSFYSLFPSSGYQALDFRNYLSILVLDSGHTHPVAGKQTEWLAAALQQRAAIPHKFALYHVPAFPSVRPFENPHSAEIRTCWVPYFEKYGLTAAFENHDHAYKRSNLINGVLYLGDGGWGVAKPREPKKCAPYLAFAAAKRSFLLITLMSDGSRTLQAYDDDGNMIDLKTKDW